MTDPQPELRAIFCDALGRPTPCERAEYLDLACQGKPELRARVEALLRAHDEASGFLQEPSADPAVTVDTGFASQGPGALIGPYKLLEPIGEGGMGTVWMAQQTEPVKRLVAVKLIKAGMDSRQIIARFEAERQALALMDHPNIARVLDGGTTDAGRPYVVMDLVKGVPITRYCDEHHLTPRQRLELFLPICQAVQHAHQKGIIHRDLKPSNVLVALYDGKPVPKVIDFGVAKAAGQQLTEKTLVTGFGNIVGTLEYMSPEQAEINQLDIDTRSDIYSLGVLLYELLTGSPPFTRKELEKAGMLEMLRVIREQEPSKPSTKLSTAEGLPTLAANRGTEPAKLTKLVRGELDWIVMKALEKDRSRRYETANGFAMDVQRYLADEPVQACPPSVGYRFRKFARRNKGPVLAASLVVMVLVAGIIGTTWGMFRATDAEADAKREAGEKTTALGEKETALATAKANEIEAQKHENRAKENAKTAKAQELLARRRFYAAQTNLALQAWEAGQPARALELLESLRPRFDQEDLRGFDWYYLWRQCHRNLHRTLGDPTREMVKALALTPDGKTLVSGSRNASIRVWDVTTGKERAVLTAHNTCIWRLAISSDGRMVASANNDHTVKLWDLGTSELLATLTAGAPVRSVDFSPDGKVLAAGTEDGALELWDVGARKQRLTLEAHGAPAIALAYSPDGKMLATGAGWNTSRGKGGVKVWDVTSDPPRIVFQAPDGTFADYSAFSPDSKFLATCHFGVKVWNVPSGELKATFASPGSNIESVAFSADGKTLVLGCHDRTVKLWEFATGAARTVGVHLGPVDAVAVVPRSDLLASGSNDSTVKLWHAGPPQDAASFAARSAIRSLAFTPDSKLLVVGSDHPTTVLDAATRKVTTTLAVGGVLATSADANRLATWAPDHKCVIWDVAAARAQAVLPVGPDVAGAAFSPDGKTLVTWIGDRAKMPSGGVRLWDLHTSRLRLTLNLADLGASAYDVLHCAAFSPDGRTLAIGRQGGAVTLWDPTTGQQRMTLQQREGPSIGAFAVAFSADGKMLAAGNNQGLLRLWNAETGQLQMSFKGHTDAIRSVAFSPDDRTLLSGSADRTARLWDVVTGQELLALKEHKYPVHLVAFAPDGKRLATASHNEVKLWLAATEPEATAFRMELDPDDPDSPQAHSDTAARLWQMGRAADAEKAYRTALTRLEKLAAASPMLPGYRDALVRTWCNLSLLQATMGRPQDAEEAGQQALEQWRRLPAGYRRSLPNDCHEFAQRRMAAREPREAVDIYSQTLKLYQKLSEDVPKDPGYRRDLAIIHNQRGHAYTLQKQHDKALADYMAASELIPEEPVIWLNLATESILSSQFDKALLAYGKVIDLKPLDPQAWFNRGEVYYRLKHHVEALDDFSRCLQLKATHFGALHLRGHCHEALGRWQESVADHTRAIELAPKAPQLYLCRGIAYAQLEEWQKAAEDFEHTTTLMPANAAACYNLALLDLRRGDVAGYRKVCSTMFQRFERYETGDAVYWTAWTHVLAPDATADWTKLLQIAERRYANDRKNYEHVNNSGAMLYRAGRLKEAAQRLSEAETVFQQTPRTHSSIVYNWLFQAMTQHRLGNTATAAKWLKKAVQEIDEPKSPQDQASMSWNRRLTLQFLRAEAEELVKK
jgi:WD40 repeat protein/serine/threonine protein kinase/Flp pilus assembly protein TadD